MYGQVFEKLNKEIKTARIMAVSKTRSLDEVKAAYEAGFRLFGENHVQEIVEKFSVFKPSDLEIHMIGHLQTNKVSKVVPIADMIESVDSLHLLEKINSACERIGKIMPVLFEFNTSKEQANSGFLTEEELFDCLDKAGEFNNIRVKGLMTVGPVNCKAEDKEMLTREAFTYLAELKNKCMIKYPHFDFGILSMGMSQDYKIGIECGSSIVRIGTAIFGERYYG